MYRTRPPSPRKVKRDWPKAAPSPAAQRGLMTALAALYGDTRCELGEAGIAEREQRHRQADAAQAVQGCLPLGVKP